MYQIINLETGVLIEEAFNPQWLKQQKLRDFPICANNLEEANGVVLSDGNTMVGIYKVDSETGESVQPNMDNYKPLVKIVEVSSDAYIMGELDRVKAQVDAVHTYQTNETVLRADLDAAYRDGVNAYTGDVTTIATKTLDEAYQEGVNQYE